MLLKILSLTGLFNIVYITVSLLICYSKNKQFSLKKHVLCYFGTLDNVGRFYNFSLFVYAFLQLLFLYVLVSHFKAERFGIVMIFTLFAVLAMSIAGIFPYSRNKRVHDFSSGFGWVFPVIATLIFHLDILENDPVSAWVGIILDILISIGSIYLLIKYKVCAIPELFFIAFVFIWNIYFTIQILHY